MKRRSPVQFSAGVVKSEKRDDWTVILAYEDEGEGPWLVDLAHKARWDLQDGGIDDLRPYGRALPLHPGGCLLKDGVLMNRMNRTQAAVWHLGRNAAGIPALPGYTDVTDATVFLALFGPRVFRITEKLTDLDFFDSNQRKPFLLQGPFSRVPCQLVTFNSTKGRAGAILMTCARGYAQGMVHAILSAGEPHGLRPAGEARFTAWLDHRVGSDGDGT